MGVGVEKEDEEEKGSDADEAKDSSFNSNSSSAGAVTIDSGNDLPDNGANIDGSIKFGTGILGSDDEDEDEDEGNESDSDSRVQKDSALDIMQESVPEASPRHQSSLRTMPPQSDHRIFWIWIMSRKARRFSRHC